MKKSRTYEYHSSIYKNEKYREHTYLLLLGTAIRYFKKVKKIEKIKLLEKKIKKQFASIGGQIDWQDFTEFNEETLIDAIKLMICFENFFKGKLIYKGYLIHEINRKIGDGKFKVLGNIHKIPIKSSKLKKTESYFVNPKDNLHYLRGIKFNRSISFGNLIRNPEYQEILKIPKKILEIIQRYNNLRNQLHLKPLEGSAYNQDSIKELKTLIDYVNKSMILKYNQLLKKLKKNPRFAETLIKY